MVSGADGVALVSWRAVLTWATEAGMASEHRGSRGASMCVVAKAIARGGCSPHGQKGRERS
jgi:hypothetical protein